MTDPSAPIDADALADALGTHRPTPQQRAVIEAPLAPALVVAGAGSGKTETMAARVLWLLANGHVRPGEILGMTFTRKAAGELAARIGLRIGELRAAGLLPGADDLETPTVSTYNSFANLVYRDNAILLGREGDGAVLGEAAAWQLARTTVVRSRDARLPDLGRNLDAIIAAVLALSRSMAENVADPDAVRAYARRMRGIADLPAGGRGRYGAVIELAETVGALDVLVALAVDFDRAKVARAAVEYSDQVRLALEIVDTEPRVVADLRGRFRVVLLDEYQDTSVVQTRLLARVFAAHPVMAVGDPNQSIYGWRGASAANLDQFSGQFAGDREVGRFALSTSWRNGVRILDLADRVVAPFREHARVPVERLSPSPRASAREVSVEVHETVAEEAAATADWLAARLAERGTDGSVPSAAVLFRSRKTQPFFLEAMRERGIPFHVLGVAGLTAEPEIADLLCALAVMDDPGAGIELVRLLAGSRWRIGASDLHALSRLASWLRDRDLAQQQLDDAVRARLRASTAEGEGASIVDALDFLHSAGESHSALSHFSEAGLPRLREAGRFFAALRTRSTLELPDLVVLVEQALHLDIEVGANDRRVVGAANLDAFHDALGGYLAIAETATLGGFLAWLREAEQREDLSPRPEDPEPGTVQVLTVHGSKGLEWDAVAVPRLVDDEFPARPREGSGGWAAFGRMPWAFRGDADDLPLFGWESAATRKEVADELARFKEEVKARGVEEERRLLYVAVTRARHSLRLSGAFWATQMKPRSPSVFLTELAGRGGAAGVDGIAVPESSVHEENPLGDDLEMIDWPLDPLGSRRPAVERAAEAVRAAEPAITGHWAREVELLLAERDARAAHAPAARPSRIPASRFKDYVSDPEGLAAALRRPMPERPYRATRLGTLFHSWVEQRFGLAGATETIDAAPTELDGDEGSADSPEAGYAEAPDDIAADRAVLARLQSTFEASPWAARRPVEVEREIQLPFDDRVLVCKIDAVFEVPPDPSAGPDAVSPRYQIVDWKTGAAPRDDADLADKQLQLALYRLAYARWRGIPPDRIDAVFYYVAEDRVIAPERLLDEGELLALWRESAVTPTAAR